MIFYDGGVGVARRLKTILDNIVISEDDNQGSIIFYDSSNNIKKEKRFYELLEK